MTMSMERALEVLNRKGEKINYDELMFFLTCLKDNALQDDVHEVLSKMLKSV